MGLGQLLVQYADKSSPQSIDPIFRPYADPSVDPESLETDGVQPQSHHDQGVTTDKDDPTTTTYLKRRSMRESAIQSCQDNQSTSK